METIKDYAIKDHAYYETRDVLKPQATVLDRWDHLASTVLTMDGIDHLWNMDLRKGLWFIQQRLTLYLKNHPNNCADFILDEVRLGDDDYIKGLEALYPTLDIIERNALIYDFTRCEIEYIRADIRILVSEMKSILGTAKSEAA